jgi:hypothetical protein
MSSDGDRKPLTELAELAPFHVMFKANELIAQWEATIGRMLTPLERSEMMAWLKASASVPVDVTPK